VRLESLTYPQRAIEVNDRRDSTPVSKREETLCIGYRRELYPPSTRVQFYR